MHYFELFLYNDSSEWRRSGSHVMRIPQGDTTHKQERQQKWGWAQCGWKIHPLQNGMSMRMNFGILNHLMMFGVSQRLQIGCKEIMLVPVDPKWAQCWMSWKKFHSCRTSKCIEEVVTRLDTNHSVALLMVGVQSCNATASNESPATDPPNFTVAECGHRRCPNSSSVQRVSQNCHMNVDDSPDWTSLKKIDYMINSTNIEDLTTRYPKADFGFGDQE